MDKFIGKDNKNRKLYEGRRGGIYYYTASGRKSYVNKAAMKRKSITKAKRRTDVDDEKKMDKSIGKDDKHRKLYEGVRGDDDDDDEKHMGKFIGKDDKNRKLYQGGKGGIYYYTDSGKKSYVNKNIKFAKSATKAKRRTAYNNYEEIKKEKPRTVTPIEIAEWKKQRPGWFDGKKVGAKSVVIKGGSIPKGTRTKTKDTMKANQKRWPIAIKAELIIQTVVPNPLPRRIRDKGDAGHLVAYTLGGDTDDSNIIPQNPTINERLGYPWRDFEDKVRKIVKESKTKEECTYTVTPIYGNVEELDAL